MNLYELFIGFRYLKSKKSQGFISFNTVLSIFIVFIGVFILILVTSVMSGFQSQIKDKILDVDSHFTVNGYNGENFDEGITNYNEVAEIVKKNKQVVSAMPYFQGQGLLRYKSKISPVLVRGLGDKNNIPMDFKKFIIDGEYKFSGAKEIYIGDEMGYNERIKIGDVVELIVPKGKFSATEGMQPGIDKFKVIGFFKTGFYDFDTTMIIMSLPVSQKFFSIGDKVWGIGVKVKDIYRVNNVAFQVQTELGYDYQTFTAEQKNQNLFYALKLERLIMTIILFLVIVSAGLTIMGTLVMVVMEKRKAIGILKSIGAGPTSIMIIFVLEGFLIGVIGTFTGVVSGIAAAINLEKVIVAIQNAINTSMTAIYELLNIGPFMEISLAPSSVYYVEGIPTVISPEFIIFISVFAVFLATVSAIFPAWQASRLNVVETIRYE